MEWTYPDPEAGEMKARQLHAGDVDGVRGRLGVGAPSAARGRGLASVVVVTTTLSTGIVIG